MGHASAANKPLPSAVRHGGLALAAGAGSACGAALLSAFLMASRGLSRNAAYGFATASVCLGCFVCAYLWARLRKSGGLLCGLLAFAAFAVPLLAAGCLHGAPAVSGLLLLRWGLLLASGLGGGVTGLLRAERRPRRH